MDTELLEKSIIELLPAIPYIVDQVGAAMNWVKDEKEESEYRKALGIALKVADYAARTSEANFYKTHLVVASLLSNIPNAIDNEKFKIFDTASKAVEKTLKDITVDEKLTQERGCFKALSMHLVPLAVKNQDNLVIMLFGILKDLEEITAGMSKADVHSPITREDYVVILGYALTVFNLFNSNLNLLNETAVVLNDIQVILNSINY